VNETLDQENARLRRQLALHGVEPLPAVDLPNAEELVELHSLIVSRYPQLACAQDQFERALLFMAFARRQSKLNASYYPTFWLDGATDWLRRNGYQADLRLAALIAAAVAAGVPHSPLHRFPHDIELGLQVGGVSRPSSAWRDVLANGVPAPQPLNRPFVVAEPITMITETPRR